MVATKDLEPMDLILEDVPAAFGPDHDTVPVCLECLKRVDGSYLCPDCDLPLCDEACYEKRDQHKVECQILSDTPTGVRLRVKFGRER